MSFPGQQQQANPQMHMQQPPYNDSILTITEKSCADPYVLFDKGTYYMVSATTCLMRRLTLTYADMDNWLLG
jgi:hypothetical protein